TRGTVWLETEGEHGVMLHIDAGDVVSKRAKDDVKLWARGAAGLRAATDLMDPARAVSRAPQKKARTTRKKGKMSQPADKSTTESASAPSSSLGDAAKAELTTLLGRKRLSADQLGRIEVLLESSVTAGDEQAAIDALSHGSHDVSMKAR